MGQAGMMEQRWMWTADLETEVHTKVRNHGDGSYYGLLLVEAATTGWLA